MEYQNYYISCWNLKVINKQRIYYYNNYDQINFKKRGSVQEHI